MRNQLSQFSTALASWAKKARDTGWLTQIQLQRLEEVETQSADTLFETPDERPLIVAFFGGTGTGKSSLLNRLAGEKIATTGATRPTSYRSTLFVHNKHQLNQSIEELPIAAADIHYHKISAQLHVAWLDMPDFDSVAQTNRTQVEEWLPYIDWIIYVVSPERYHDDIGWQILNTRHHRHQWLFVMNHWDEGQAEQLSDFRRRLDEAGFKEAALLPTSCTVKLEDDQFQRIDSILTQAIAKHGIDQLQQTGLRARIDDYQKLQAEYAQSLGTTDQWSQFKHANEKFIAQQTKTYVQILQDQALILLQPLQSAEQQTSWLGGKQRARTFPDTNTVIDSLAGDRTQKSLHRVIQEQIQACHQAGLPSGVLEQKLVMLESESTEKLVSTLQNTVSDALARPGTRLQRWLFNSFGWLGFLLPLGIALWAGWYLFSHFRGGMAGTSEFLGFNFISNTVMLLALGWFVPWLIRRRLQPSLVASFKRGLFNGIDQSANHLGDYLKHAHQSIETELQQQLESLNNIRP